jgi:3'-5' exoribonuclease
MKISEMKIGQTITAEVVLAGASIRQTKSNPPRDFLNVDLTDGTDTLEGKIWNYDGSKGVPESNKVYSIYGSISEYQGKKQITIQKLDLAVNQDMTPFCCTYFSNLERLAEVVNRHIDKIGDERLRNVTRFIYDSYWDKILHATSAKGVHHVGIGGNAYHSIEVYDIAEKIAEYYQVVRCDDISVDLVRAGALLHDIGKPFVYDINGAVIGYTLNGTLFEHIVNGLAILNQAAQHFDQSYNETFALLAHIISSHHGKLEYGSPVTPKFVEAYIINYADGISASLDTLLTANDKAIKEGKAMTDKLWTLNNQEHLLQRAVAEMLRNHEQA